MKNEIQHTPTPWKIEIEEEGYISIIGSRVNQVWGNQVALTPMKKEDKSNAEFIVRAVNSHEELLAAAKWALATMKNHSTSVKVALENAIFKAEARL